MRRTVTTTSLLALGILGLGLAACGIGGPGENNNNNLQRPDSGVDAAAPDGGQNNNNAPAVQTLTVQELRDNYVYETLGQSIVDLREAHACWQAHIPESFCVPETDLWDGADFLANASALSSITRDVYVNPLIFYSTASRSATVMAIAEASLDLGYEDVYVVEGGIEAWRAEGWYQDISREGIEDLYYTTDASDTPIPAGVFVVDTMDAATYEAGHIKCAENINGDLLWYNGTIQEDAEALLNNLALPGANPVFIFYCVNEGCASSEAASFAAEELGYPTVLHYSKGSEDWEEGGHELVTGTEACGN